MVATAQDLVLGVSQITVEQIVAYAVNHGAQRPVFIKIYFTKLRELCVKYIIRFEVLVGQWADETDIGLSDLWINKGNPAGIGALGDVGGPTTYIGITYNTGEESAYGHFIHFHVYIKGPIPDELLPYKKFDPRYQAALDAGFAGIVKVIDDLSGRWAMNPNYGVQIAGHMDAAFPGLKPPGAPVYSTDIPGLPGGNLETMYPVKKLILETYKTNNRPGIIASEPRRSVQHGNGNPYSTAQAEARYLYNGAEGRQASYHSTVDDKEVWVMIPINEVTWQAADGSGPGNMNGFSNEMVEDSALWSDPARRNRVIHNGADFMGRVAARLHIAIPEQHWDFNYNNPPSERHDCPNKLRYVYINGRLAWDIYKEQWYAAKADELEKMGEELPPVYVIRRVPPPYTGDDVQWKLPNGTTILLRACSRNYTVIVTETPRLQVFSSTGPQVGPPLKKGEKFKAVYRATNGTVTYVVTEIGTVIRAAHLTPTVSISDKSI